jgi:hypothetical protein
VGKGSPIGFPSLFCTLKGAIDRARGDRVEQDIRAGVVNVTPQGELIPGHLYTDFERALVPARRQAPEADREEVGRVDGRGGLRLPLAPRKPRPAAGLSLRKYATRTSRASSRSGSARPTTLRRRWRFGRRSRAGNTARRATVTSSSSELDPKTRAAVKNPPVCAIPRARSARVGPALALSEKRLGMSGERRGVLGKARKAPTLLLLRTAQRFAVLSATFRDAYFMIQPLGATCRDFARGRAPPVLQKSPGSPSRR